MSDVSVWMVLQSTMQDDGTRRSVSRATLRRVAAFARPHRRALVAFLLLSTAGAVLGVATPVLAGRAVDAIVAGGDIGSIVAGGDKGSIAAGGDRGTVVGLAVVIAVLAVVGTGLGLAER